MTRILFVCLGNICRSPAAEAVMNKICEDNGVSRQIFCDSAGTSGYHEGESADPRMIKTGRDRGYNLTSKSRLFDPHTDFDHFDLIITMDDSNFTNVEKESPSDFFSKKIKTMCSFMSESGINEVPDPYYGGPSGFHQVFDILENACNGLLDELKIKPNS